MNKYIYDNSNRKSHVMGRQDERSSSLPFSHRMIQILALPLEKSKQKKYNVNDHSNICREGRKDIAHSLKMNSI